MIEIPKKPPKFFKSTKTSLKSILKHPDINGKKINDVSDVSVVRDNFGGGGVCLIGFLFHHKPLFPSRPSRVICECGGSEDKSPQVVHIFRKMIIFLYIYIGYK